jgi:hypothetical protein
MPYVGLGDQVACPVAGQPFAQVGSNALLALAGIQLSATQQAQMTACGSAALTPDQVTAFDAASSSTLAPAIPASTGVFGLTSTQLEMAAAGGVALLLLLFSGRK